MEIKLVRRSMTKLMLIFMLVTVPLSNPPSSAISSVQPAAKAPLAQIQDPFTLHGSVKDQSGNPIQASIWVQVWQGPVLPEILTDVNGIYSATISVREKMAVMAVPHGLITMPDGYQISKYFELTKGIMPASDSVEVNFVVPPAAVLRLAAYNPTGDLLNFDAVYKALNPPDYLGYGGIYGVFPMSSIDLAVPEEPSIGMFRLGLATR